MTPPIKSFKLLIRRQNYRSGTTDNTTKDSSGINTSSVPKHKRKGAKTLRIWQFL